MSPTTPHNLRWQRALDQQARWTERVNHLPEGSVSLSLVDGELVFYTNGCVAGRIDAVSTRSIISTQERLWEGK